MHYLLWFSFFCFSLGGGHIVIENFVELLLNRNNILLDRIDITKVF